LFGTALLACALLPWLTGATPRAADNEPVRAKELPGDAKQARAPSRQPPALTPAAAGVLFAIAHRTADATNANALFAPKSWYTPPPPPLPLAEQPAAAPTAPPLPFAFLGRYTDGNDETVYFVTRDDRVYDVKPGSAIDSLYSVESVEGGQLVFLYKPLNVRQQLATGDPP
jgi:hypothetical protein